MYSYSAFKYKINSLTYELFIEPLRAILIKTHQLLSKGDRPLQMTFENQLNALIYFHLQEHTSARHLIQDMKDNEFARQCIAPEEGISRSSFSEAINSRGLGQLQFVFQELSKKAKILLPKEYVTLGDLAAIDGSLIDAVLSMYWADYRKGVKKAEGHFGFNINQGIPTEFHLSNGKDAERPFAGIILSPGETGVMDRCYQSRKVFDLLQSEGKHFVCRIKASTTKTIIEENPVNPNSFILYDKKVLLGTPGKNQTNIPLRAAGYKIGGVEYFAAADRYDLTAGQVAAIYKPRWRIETFFKWWKQHLKVYHLIARSRYGLMVQILGGLVTYLLMSIYCHKQFNEKVSIKRIRELRTTILNELYAGHHTEPNQEDFKEQRKLYAKT
jgi:hypothetical protein